MEASQRRALKICQSCTIVAVANSAEIAAAQAKKTTTDQNSAKIADYECSISSQRLMIQREVEWFRYSKIRDEKVILQSGVQKRCHLGGDDALGAQSGGVPVLGRSGSERQISSESSKVLWALVSTMEEESKTDREQSYLR